eukprot:SAG31_NODE_18747_length_624_cov_0.880000_2_plen_63_part_01
MAARGSRLLTYEKEQQRKGVRGPRASDHCAVVADDVRGRQRHVRGIRAEEARLAASHHHFDKQ